MARSRDERSEAACAPDAVVVIVNVDVAALPFGVTDFGDILQVVNAGAPPQLTLTTLLNEPPTGETATWYVAVAPAFRVSLLGELVRLKSAPAPVRFTI